MQISPPPVPLQERFDALLVSTELANRLIGKRLPGEVTYEESEQGDARRRLLYVEKLAIKQKVNDAQAHAAIVQEVSDKLHSHVKSELKPALSNGFELFHKVIHLEDDVTEVFDLLATRACSVSKLEPVIKNLSWLQEELLRTVNSAEHRRIDAKGKVIVVESIRTALSYLGIENLRKLIPMLVLKHTLPIITDPYPQIKQRLLEYFLAVANACAVLAELRGQPVFNAYIFGMLSGVGLCATWRQFFKVYENLQQEAVSEAMNKRDQDTYGALQIIQPSPVKLAEFRQVFEHDTATKVFEFMVFKRLNVLEPWTDSSLPMAKILTNAQNYAQLKMLIRHRLIEKDEVKEALQGLDIDRAELDKLNKEELFKVNMQQFGA